MNNLKAEMFEGIEVFEAILSGYHTTQRALQEHASAKLKDQIVMIAEGQLESVESLKSELLTELAQANKIIEACRSKLEANHNKFSSKSCLKHSLTAYLKTIQVSDLEALESLLDIDILTCKQSVENASKSAEKFNQDYTKLLAKQQKILTAFLESSSQTLYGGRRNDPKIEDLKNLDLDDTNCIVQAQSQETHRGCGFRNLIQKEPIQHNFNIYIATGQRDSWVTYDFKGEQVLVAGLGFTSAMEAWELHPNEVKAIGYESNADSDGFELGSWKLNYNNEYNYTEKFPLKEETAVGKLRFELTNTRNNHIEFARIRVYVMNDS